MPLTLTAAESDSAVVTPDDAGVTVTDGVVSVGFCGVVPPPAPPPQATRAVANPQMRTTKQGKCAERLRFISVRPI